MVLGVIEIVHVSANRHLNSHLSCGCPIISFSSLFQLTWGCLPLAGRMCQVWQISRTFCFRQRKRKSLYSLALQLQVEQPAPGTFLITTFMRHLLRIQLCKLLEELKIAYGLMDLGKCWGASLWATHFINSIAPTESFGESFSTSIWVTVTNSAALIMEITCIFCKLAEGKLLLQPGH